MMNKKEFEEFKESVMDRIDPAREIRRFIQEIEEQNKKAKPNDKRRTTKRTR